jgi:hypothetical protein
MFLRLLGKSKMLRDETGHFRYTDEERTAIFAAVPDLDAKIDALKVPRIKQRENLLPLEAATMFVAMNKDHWIDELEVVADIYLSGVGQETQQIFSFSDRSSRELVKNICQSAAELSDLLGQWENTSISKKREFFFDRDPRFEWFYDFKNSAFQQYLNAVQYVAKRRLAMMGKGPKDNASKGDRRSFLHGILACWESVGGLLKVSQSGKVVHGPLIRFLQAATDPVMDAKNVKRISPKIFKNEVDREKRERGLRRVRPKSNVKMVV